MKRGPYATAVLAVFHGLLLFTALNLAAWGILEALPQDPVTLTYGDRAFGTVYPGRSREEVRELLRETWTRPTAYEPFTNSRERRYRGRFVNVDPAGFRRSRDQGPWPPDPARMNVYVLGGSTTFGYGVADDETIVSALQAFLDGRLGAGRAACYNFGRGGYYSTGERVLFEELLAAGAAPRVAVFVDGLNEFALGVPLLADRLRRYVNSPVGTALRTLGEDLPLTRLVARRKAVRPARRSAAERAAAFDDAPLLDARIERYLANLRLIRAAANSAGARVLFVWQPVPTYRYDLRHHLFGDLDFEKNEYSAFGYPRMAERVRRDPPGPDFLWAADLQEGANQPLYVDQIHYTAAASRLIADEIGRGLVGRGLVP